MFFFSSWKILFVSLFTYFYFIIYLFLLLLTFSCFLYMLNMFVVYVLHVPVHICCIARFLKLRDQDGKTKFLDQLLLHRNLDF